MYDRADAHYDTISAFIKSMRGSDPDAAVYYLASMIAGGEDPKFIARRMIVFASEDVGNADPQALQVVVAAARAVEFVGLPECRINLSQAATYLALAPKSNAAYKAVDAALDDVRREGNQPPPPHLRSANYRGAKELGHGAGYKYPHATGGWVPQQYLPDRLSGRRYYVPIRGVESKLAARLEEIRRRAASATKVRRERDVSGVYVWILVFLILALVALVVVWFLARRVKRELDDSPGALAGAKAALELDAGQRGPSARTQCRAYPARSRATRACGCRSSTGRCSRSMAFVGKDVSGALTEAAVTSDRGVGSQVGGPASRAREDGSVSVQRLA